MRRILIVPVIAGIVLTMAACGAKDEAATATNQPSAKSSDQTTTTAEKQTSTTESEDDTSDTTADDTSDTTEDDSSTGGVSDLPNGLDDDCIAISTLYVDIMAQSTSLMVPGAMSTEELDKLEKELDEARSKSEIPDEIKDDFETWSAAWAEFGEAMKDLGDKGAMDPANVAKFQEATEIIEAPEVEAAGKRIEAYVTDQCVAGGIGEK